MPPSTPRAPIWPPWGQRSGPERSRGLRLVLELWVDSGPWLVYPLLAFALFAFQRGRLAVLLMLPSLALMTNAPAKAADAPW